MFRRLCILLTISVAAILSTFAHAQPEEARPVQSLTAIVADFKGQVHWRPGAEGDWQRVAARQQLDEGSEIRTGVGSYVRLLLPPDQIVAIDRLSRVTLLRAFFDDARIQYKTELGMEYGRVRYDIQTAGAEHEATIYSPNATLAIRGTDAQLDDMPGYPARITSHHGRIAGTFDGVTVVMGNTRRATATSNRPTPADEALGQTRVDPLGAFAGRTETEFLLIEDYPAIGGFDPALQAVLAARALGFESENVFTGTIRPEESLFFLLGFAGVPGITNLDLLITDPQGNVLSKNMTTSPTGGFHSGDGFAVGEAGEGEESVFFPLSVPKGTYTVRVQLVPQIEFPDDGAVGFVQVVGNNQPIQNFGPLFFSPNNPQFETQVQINELPVIEVTE